MKLKSLKEKRNNLLNELEEMVSGLENQGEVRSLTVEERADFDAKKAEIEGIDTDIKRITEARALAMGNEAVAQLAEERKAEDIEARALENFFRGQDLIGEERTILASANSALMPLEISKTILKRLEEICPVLEMAKRFSSKGTLRLLLEDNYGAAGLTAENEAFTDAEATFRTVELRSYKVSAMVQATFELLQNSDVDLTSYLTDVIIRRLGKELNRMFIAGNGTNQPQGLLNAANKYTFATDELIIADFIKMQTSIHPTYLNKAVWIVNRPTFQKMASLLDGNGRPYLVANVIADKVQYSLLGLPVVVDMNMEECAAGKKPVILANIEECYSVNMLTDITIRHLVESGFVNGVECFAGYVLCDGKIVNEDAVVIGEVAGASVAKASRAK